MKRWQTFYLTTAAVGWLAAFAAIAQKTNFGVEVVPRAGTPGQPMLLGTSVMSPAENLLVKSLGFSHAQTDSDHLTVNEPQPGHWDWKDADAGLAAMQQAGMKWQYFPHFHWPPEWYRQSPKFVPSIGLRSNRKIAAMSIWSPDVVPWFDHCYAALAQHYGGGNDKMYAIYIGIHGDFGETIFPMGWHPNEKKYFGENGMGTVDFWCGDNFAREDFRQFAKSKYSAVAVLNTVWGTQYKDFPEIDYPPAAYGKGAGITTTPESRRYWLDFIGWYYDSMTRFTGQVCKIARHYFQASILEIPVGGGNENVVYGQDTTALPKMARDYNVQIRSTHGGYAPFAEGYAGMIKRIVTPCKIYGVPHWLEPPGGITPDAEVGRIMEAVSCGNFGFWDWGSNPVNNTNVYRAYTNFFTREKPVVDVALFFPTTDHRLNPRINFPRHLQAVGERLRDIMDFDMVDEELMADNALDHYRVLIWVEGDYVEQKNLRTLAAWVKHGGVLLYGNVNSPQTVEGDSSLGLSLLGRTENTNSAEGGTIEIKDPQFLRHLAARHDNHAAASVNTIEKHARVLATVENRPAIWAMPYGKGWVITGSVDHGEFEELARDVDYNLSKLDPNKTDATEVDADWDGVYSTLLANGEVILYNSTADARSKTIAGKTILLPPKSLRSALLKTWP